jgi:adenylate cyclase, class 2
MKEKELKILDVDVGDLTKMLEKLGAKKDFVGDVTGEYYDWPDRRLEKEDITWRLRPSTPAVLTIKKRIDRHKALKICEEENIPVLDAEALRRVLKLAGMQCIMTIIKHRISYTLRNAHCEIDTVPGVPAYLEVEAETRTDLEECLALLGFSIDDGVNWSTQKVIAHYKKLRKKKAKH